VATLRQTADSVADATRALCQLTLGPGDELRHPDDVSDVIGSLSVAMSLMPQLLGQLAAFLEVEHVKGAITHGHGDAGECVRAASDALHRAGLDAEMMAAALDAAHEACRGLKPAGQPSHPPELPGPERDHFVT
jgi:hypothetical protein